MQRTRNWIPTFVLAAAAALTAGVWWTVGGSPETVSTTLTYPEAPRGDHKDVYHGVSVADPYRPLEDLDAPETRRWVKAQDTLARTRLEGTPAHRTLAPRLAELAQIQVYGLPVSAGKDGDTLFFTRGDGGRRHGVLYRKQGDGEPQVVLDVNQLSANRKQPSAAQGEGSTILWGFVPSPDARRVAYGLTTSGRRWTTLKIRDLKSGKDLEETLTGFFGGVSGIVWRRDGQGFYYGYHQPPVPGEELTTTIGPQSLRYHRLGTPQTEDPFLYNPPDDGAWSVTPTVTEDGRYLMIAVRQGTAPGNRLFYRSLTETTSDAGDWHALVEGDDANLTFLGNSWDEGKEGEHSEQFFLWTDRDAPRGRIVAVAPEAPDSGTWQTLVPQGEATITSASVVGNRFTVLYSVDARPVVRIHGLDGKLQGEAPLPAIAWTARIAGQPSDRYGYYRLSGLTDPGTVYRLDPRTGESSLWARGDLAFDPEDFVTRQVFFQSPDGSDKIKIPMFLSHRKGLKIDGERPLLIYGYGAFAWSAVPWFQPEVVAWMEMGGVYALPNIRGGGEYGKEWYEAGIGRNKQNSINDFLAATQWLVDHGYTRPDRLVARGGSASGPLVGAAITQRPDLYGAALINIPALDMLRYAAFTGGRRWVEEFGSVQDPEEFQALKAYSPYHNIRPGKCYPATLLTAGEKDETTVPSHAYKFTAALQAAQECERPVLLQVAWGAGHAYGRNRAESGETLARQLSFLAQELDMVPVRRAAAER